MVAEYDQNGNLVAKYHHDGGGLMAMTRNNSSYWYGFEAIGTTRQLMDGQGQVLDAYAFDAWGNELTSPQSQVPNPFKYVGKHGYYLDTESALMLLGVRYYNSLVGRFISLDPIKDDKNWFLYCSNNPIVRKDISGLSWISIPICEMPPGFNCCHTFINIPIGPGGTTIPIPIWCPRRKDPECQKCAKSEGFQNVGEYCKQYEDWRKKRPKIPGSKDLDCIRLNLAKCIKYGKDNCPKGSGRDKCLHCLTSCCLAKNCGDVAAEFVGWCNEMMQLTDCNLTDRTTFDPKDHFDANMDGIRAAPKDCEGCKKYTGGKKSPPPP